MNKKKKEIQHEKVKKGQKQTWEYRTRQNLPYSGNCLSIPEPIEGSVAERPQADSG